VEGLNFFEVLLGDKPAFTPQESFYQRDPGSGDPTELSRLIGGSLKSSSTKL
jgi:hypothetical protein